MYLSWDLNTQWPTDSNLLNSLMVSHDTAREWLGHLEPLQLGYGAVIISFLGAIHWGLEFAEKSVSYDSPKAWERARFRYGLGVAASVIAWPTVLMPIEWALTTQFLAFTMLYFADSRATTRGWTPPWYGTYRFVLTFIVGSAILLSLVGRAKIGEGKHAITEENLRESMQKGVKGEEKYVDWAKLEDEERQRQKKAKEEEEKHKKDGEMKQREKEENKARKDGKDAKKDNNMKDDGKAEDGKDDGGKSSDDDKAEKEKKT
jgi:hypothetical protein